MKSLFSFSFALFAALAAATSAGASSDYTLGVNLAGAEFASGSLPGKEGTHWHWPKENELDAWSAEGIDLVRLPFLWERIQPVLFGDLDATYSAGLVRTVRAANARGIRVLPDVHNYGKWRGDLIGSESVPVAAFADLWRRLALLLRDEPGVWGYGLMNEPNKACSWVAAAQAAIDAIRSVDTSTQILVANDYAGWAASHIKAGTDLATWAENGLPIARPDVLSDPSDNLRFELHAYLDHDNSGLYKYSYEHEITRTDGPGARVGPEVGVTRVRPFAAWLRRYGARGFLGEFGCPANPEVDGRWLVALDNLAAFLHDEGIPGTLWAAGRHWNHGNSYVADPQGWSKTLDTALRARTRPQTLVLKKNAEPSRLSEAEARQLDAYIAGEWGELPTEIVITTVITICASANGTHVTSSTTTVTNTPAVTR